MKPSDSEDMKSGKSERTQRLGVRVTPMWYEWHDDDCADACYYRNVWGTVYVQPRHLESSKMSTWN